MPMLPSATSLATGRRGRRDARAPGGRRGGCGRRRRAERRGRGAAGPAGGGAAGAARRAAAAQRRAGARAPGAGLPGVGRVGGRHSGPAVPQRRCTRRCGPGSRWTHAASSLPCPEVSCQRKRRAADTARPFFPHPAPPQSVAELERRGAALQEDREAVRLPEGRWQAGLVHDAGRSCKAARRIGLHSELLKPLPLHSTNRPTDDRPQRHAVGAGGDAGRGAAGPAGRDGGRRGGEGGQAAACLCR